LGLIITILQAIYNGRTNIPDELKIDSYGRSFWASQGEYLRKSSLTTITKGVARLETPNTLFNNTILDDDVDNDVDDDDGVNEAQGVKKGQEDDSDGKRLLEGLAAVIDMAQVLRSRKAADEDMSHENDHDQDMGKYHDLDDHNIEEK
jgi:hypothetical protein